MKYTTINYNEPDNYISWFVQLTNKEYGELYDEFNIYNDWMHKWLLLGLAPIDCYTGNNTLEIINNPCCLKDNHPYLITNFDKGLSICYTDDEGNFKYQMMCDNSADLSVLKNIITSKFDYFETFGMAYRALPMTLKIIERRNKYPIKK